MSLHHRSQWATLPLSERSYSMAGNAIGKCTEIQLLFDKKKKPFRWTLVINKTDHVSDLKKKNNSEGQKVQINCFLWRNISKQCKVMMRSTQFTVQQCIWPFSGYLKVLVFLYTHSLYCPIYSLSVQCDEMCLLHFTIPEEPWEAGV